MRILLYFVVVLAATLLGAITGLGGGVIIKPALDMLGHYDVTVISALSAVTVLVMAVVSVARHLQARTAIDKGFAAALAGGAVAGSYFGNACFTALAGGIAQREVKIIQNTILALLVLLVLWYTLRRKHVSSPALRGWPAAVLVGAAMGMLSSFLGIGGGPMNVAGLTLAFALPTKSAAVYSLVIILFAQCAKMASLLLEGDFALLLQPVLPAMLLAAVLGGFLGAKLNQQLSHKMVDRLFLAAQVIVLALCVYNIATNL